MSERETPETDNKFNRVNADDVSAYTIALEMRNFARKLERERDEARELYALDVATAKAERDEARRLNSAKGVDRLREIRAARRGGGRMNGAHSFTEASNCHVNERPTLALQDVRYTPFFGVYVARVDGFRSQPTVNTDEDMVRVVLDMPKCTWRKLKSIIHPTAYQTETTTIREEDDAHKASCETS